MAIWKFIAIFVGILLCVWGLIELVTSGIWGIVVAFVLLTAFLSVVFILSSGAAIPRLLTWFGTKDEWWSPVRQLPGPGDIAIVVRGTSTGPLYQLIHNVQGWYYREVKQQFYRLRPGQVNPEHEEENWLARYLREHGLKWVHFNRSYYRRIRRYDSWERIPGSNKWGVVDKETEKDKSHIIHFVTTMAARLEKIPTKKFYAVSFTATWNTLLVSPIRAEFSAGKWEVQATSAVMSRSREYASSRTVEQLRSERDQAKKEDFVDYISLANWGKKSEGPKTIRLTPAYGIKIEASQMVEPDFESGDVEMFNALQRQAIAEADVKTSEIRIKEEENKGKGEAARRTAAAEGTKAEYAARDSSRNARTYAMTDAIRDTSPKFLSLGGDGMAGVMLDPDDKHDHPGPNKPSPEKPSGDNSTTKKPYNKGSDAPKKDSDKK